MQSQRRKLRTWLMPVKAFMSALLCSSPLCLHVLTKGLLGRPKQGSAECKWTIKPLHSELASVRAYGRPEKEEENNTQMEVLFFCR